MKGTIYSLSDVNNNQAKSCVLRGDIVANGVLGDSGLSPLLLVDLSTCTAHLLSQFLHAASLNFLCFRHFCISYLVRLSSPSHQDFETICHVFVTMETYSSNLHFSWREPYQPYMEHLIIKVVFFV